MTRRRYRCRPGGYGKRGNPTRNVWREMWKRCTNARCKSFKWYGARGIAVCERWRSFENFLADMGPRPVGLTLDRENPNGNYEPGNCRWATALEQGTTRRNSVRFVVDGASLTRREVAQRTGLSYSAIRHRGERGKPVADPRAERSSMSRLTTESVRSYRARRAAGEPLSALAAEAGVSKPTLWKAIVGKTWRDV